MDYSLILQWLAWTMVLVLLIHTRKEFRRMKKAFAAQRKDFEALRHNFRRLEDLMLDTERRLEETEDRSAKLVPPPASRSGLNIDKRAQAAKMFRRGDQPQQIAAVLGLPRNEVDLLLKVQRTMAS